MDEPYGGRRGGRTLAESAPRITLIATEIGAPRRATALQRTGRL